MICPRLVHQNVISSLRRQSRTIVSHIPPARLPLVHLGNVTNRQSLLANSAKRNAPLTEEDLIQITELFELRKQLTKELSVKKAALSRDEIRASVAEAQDCTRRLNDMAESIVNLTSPHTPAQEPQALVTGGPPIRSDNMNVHHADSLGKAGLYHDTQSAMIFGSGFRAFSGPIAQLGHALEAFALDTAMEEGFEMIHIPDVIRKNIAEGCGFKPRLRDGRESTMDMYSISDSQVLSATAEIPLAGFLAVKTLRKQDLPRKFVATSHAFRPETGNGGSDTRGLYRLHQFTKVELFAITAGNDKDTWGIDSVQSRDMLAEITGLQLKIVRALNIPFRMLDMPAHELGASAYRKIDIEAHMPGRTGKWGEITSASNCTDFQSRRLSILYESGADKRRFVHTVNGTAAAIPRLIIALVENGAVYQKGGSALLQIRLPRCLERYWIGSQQMVEFVDV